ncbi:hypothetical protein NUKP67_02500 [Klebsiella variicola]|nr:hypothetical protein NUKP67_02500 [Klebsiella variicola]CAB5644629.1 Possible hemagglutinin (DUF638) [Klebsiella variicola]SLN88710.1 filamentous hemagglutinin family protein [Klebsiella variicola]
MTSALLAGGGNSGHAEGTTQSAVSEGTITIRDRENQKQDVADLSRDTEHASGSIGPIFDKEKEQRRLQEVQLTGEIGRQAADIARTQGQINALEAARKVHPAMSAEQLKETQTYKDEQAKYGTGSDIQRGIQAATAALQGLAGGDIAGALAGASAPELANLIGHGSGLSDGAAVVAHAILGGAVAALQGNSAAAGAAGAAAGELAAKAIAGMLYPDVTDLSTLTEAQKQTVSTLATISAGMAGGLAGDSTASAVAGAQAGKNAAENNSLSKKDKIFDINPMLKIGIEGADGDPLKGGGGIGKFTINKGQQNKHLPGTNEYKIASEAGLNKSILTVSPDLFLPKLGTGQQVGNTPVGTPGSKERINYGQNIGNYIDPQTGVSTPTTNGIVHYGKNGVHIVPARPSE